MRCRAILSAVAVFGLAVPAWAATLTVDLNGGADYTAIQPAIDAAADGDTVLVKPGEYVITEPITYGGKAITVQAQAGPDSTVIRMSKHTLDPNRRSVVVFESGETVAAMLEGFTLTGGRRAPGYEGGVECFNSSPSLSLCIIKGNAGGLNCYHSSPKLTNCTIIVKEGRYSGVECSDSSPTLTNCTIVMESSIAGGGPGVSCNDSSPVITSCIIWSSSGEGIAAWNQGPPGGPTPTVSYSCVEGATVWPGVGNINTDPRFCGWPMAQFWIDAANPRPGDGTQNNPYQTLASGLSGYSLELQPGSPCIGTGQGGANMGAWGQGPTAGAQSLRIHLLPGTYSIEGLTLFQHVSIQGSGQNNTTIEGTVHGLRTGQFISGVTVTKGRNSGIVVMARESPSIKDCTIAGNLGFDWVWGGGGIHCGDNSSPTIANCTIAGNGTDGPGGGVYCDAGSSPALSNCTITGNWVTRCYGEWCHHGAVECGSGAMATLGNCVIWGNSGEGIVEDDSPEALSPTVSYSCVEGATVWPGVGNINTDPRFCGWPMAQFWIDAANPRPGDGTQNNPYQTLASGLSGYSLELQPGSPCIGTGQGGANMGAWGQGPTAGAQSLRIHLLPGTYSIEGLTLFQHVSIQGSGQNNTTIEGTVHGLRTGQFISGVRITRGIFSGLVVSCREAPCVQDCVIEENVSLIGGGVLCGVGSSPAFTNCTIRNNCAEEWGDEGWGGGAYCPESAPIFLDCAIVGNVALRGGGIYSLSAGSLVNCLIAGNVAHGMSDWFGEGGGVLLHSGLDDGPSLVNCTIAGNSADNSGGGLYFYYDFGDSSTAEVSNCIIWGNGLDGVVVDGSVGAAMPTISYSCVQGATAWPGTGNIKDDPLFVQPGNDYHLQAGSPCIDAGTSNDAPTTDIEGNGRPCGAGVDIGAYESGDCPANFPKFKRGDPNSDNKIDIADAIFTLSYLFAKGKVPSCLDAADANDSGTIDIADAIAILGHLFASTGSLPEPFGNCGVDPTIDALDCASYPHCEGPKR